MTPEQTAAFLGLLADRGTAAWERVPAAGATELIVDSSGADVVVQALVGRGFRALDVDLPTRVVLAHPRHGEVVVRPCAFAADGTARGTEDDGRPLVLPPSAFDAAGSAHPTVRAPVP